MRSIASKVLTMILGMVLCSFGQESTPISQADQANLTGLTTPVEIQFSDGRLVEGSGFFYFDSGPDTKGSQSPHWVSIKHVYVVTAKHVIQPERIRQIVAFRYALRVGNKGGGADWYQMKLDKKQLGERLHLCHNQLVDVAAVEVTDKLNTATMQLLSERASLLAFNGITSNNFPGKSDVQVQPGDDIIVIGYPLGIFDTFNKLPTLKTGVLNTPIGLRFNGLDAFLLDFKYYEGSSGSIIISKPTHLAFNKQGLLEYSTSPEYVFLGVYQGEEYWNDTIPESADLGLGWYYYNVEEAIKNPPFVH